ncbi:hypothetical protein CC86DRAFT_463746 [Ophiobolus disseminans]|uniref:Uncharacterized protein n=1 Tax=Ophiobolus disseminans TaxID=1469910 RepID=A0A6A7ABC3_9PLEO|nr:hypothetical protein CC86DRAFT_463746 [Ophiobolus disseminans]
MRFNIVLVAGALLPFATRAFPRDERRPDTCAKAVASGPVKPPRDTPRAVVAKSDCASFLSKTVSPCPITSTKTLTLTKSAKATTRTSTTNVTTTITAISTALKTIDLSVFLTEQHTQLATLVLPKNITSLITETTTTTSTVFETAQFTTTFSTATVTSFAVVTSTLPPLEKRATDTDVTPSVLPDRTHLMAPSNNTVNPRDERAAVQCRPSIRTASVIPTYASACRSSPAYSTACQQLGVSEKITTLRPSTAYLTTTTTESTTPTLLVTTTQTIKAVVTKVITIPTTRLRTSINNITTTKTLTTNSTSILTFTATSTLSLLTTATSTSTLSAIITTTQTLTSTLLATPSTSTVSAIAITTQPLTSTALTTPSPAPACPSTFLLTASGALAGTYIRSLGASDKLVFTFDRSQAASFALDAQSRLYEPSTGLYPNTDDVPLYFVYMETAETVEGAGYVYLTCSTEGGKLGCGKSGREVGVFYHCPVTGPPDAVVFGTGGLGLGNLDCVAVGVGVDCD